MEKKPAQILSGCSGCLTLLFLLGLVVSAILPVATSGKASWEEVIPFAGVSGFCCFFSFLILGVGIFFVIKANKEGGPMDEEDMM